jgi:anti-anti-sigma factor
VEIGFSIQDGGKDRRCFVLQVRGEIDLNTVERLARRIRSFPLADTVVVDLGGVTFIDSSGIKVLAQSKEERGDRFRIHGAPPPITHVFETAGLLRLLES